MAACHKVNARCRCPGRFLPDLNSSDEEFTPGTRTCRSRFAKVKEALVSNGEIVHRGLRGGYAGVDGADVLAADVVIVEEEASLDAQAFCVLDGLERLSYERDRLDVRPDDGRKALS